MSRRISSQILLAIVGTAGAVGVALAQGSGLTGQYYDTAGFGSLKTTRVDPVVDFAWGTAIPSGTALTNADTFSVAWSGQLEPEFSGMHLFYVTADDGARLWVDDRLVTLRTFAQGGGEMRGQAWLAAGRKVNVRLEYVEQTGAAAVKLEWSCAERAREVIPAARLHPAPADKAGGALMREHWGGIPGTAVADLTADPDFPARPDGREFLTSFECLARDWADGFGTRVTGYLAPPVSGDYTLAVSGDDTVELRLSSDESEANISTVAAVSAATGFRSWGEQAGQQSAPVALVQGRRYFVELLHKEGAGADHWSVGWRKPGDAGIEVVPGSALVQPGIGRAQPAEAALLDGMAQEHPRIFATAERFAALRAVWQSAAPGQRKTWAQNAVNSATTILGQAPVAYSPDNRGTILGQARTAVDRIYKLGMAWWLTGDNAHAERAWSELEAVAAFPDWHPAHFLDTAEMTHACAIGYDWFYHYWTPARRDVIRAAIVGKGLNAGLSQYTGNAGWTKSTSNNWNQVCNGGLTMGALALGTEEESLAENILNRALNSTRPVWAHFTTDNGAWFEGPGYWGYTTEYGVRMLAGLEWVLGSDFGISRTPGVAEAGLAPILSLGPSNLVFNYADAGAGGASRGPVFQWFARRFGVPVFNGWENQGGGGALDALWHDAAGESVEAARVPPDMAFHGPAGTAFKPQEMVVLRGRWNDSRATFVGCKGGEMAAAHGNLDAGTFVLDALGKRWFHELGGDDYALPGYFTSTPNPNGTDRWDYYRCRAEGQNTLVIEPGAGPDMTTGAVAPLVAFQSEPAGGGSLAIHDLTPVFGGVTRVWRGIRLTGARDEALVQDEIAAASGRTVWWFAHVKHPSTGVEIAPDGSSALLTQGTDRLWCRILGGGGSFQVMDAVPLPTSPNPAGQNANSSFRKLAIRLENVTNATLAVWFVPLAAGEAPPTELPALSPLATWNLTAAGDPPVATGGNAALDGDRAVDIDLRAYVTDDATPAGQMRFQVANPVNGTVEMLGDGFTARFTPLAGYTGGPRFEFTATDTTPDPRMVVAYDFDPPDPSDPAVVPDVSDHGGQGMLDSIGSGAAAPVPEAPAALGRAGRSLELAENGGANGARLTRVLGSGEVDFDGGDWTIAGWFKRRDAGSDDMIWHLNNGDGYGSQDELYLIARGASEVALHHYPGPDIDLAGTAPPGVWHHFAVVRDGGTLRLYLNGALAGSDNGHTFVINQSEPLVFGGHTATSATYVPRWLDGWLDELCVLDAPLTDAEVAVLAGGMTVRHFGGLSATGTILLAEPPVTHNWTAAASGGWSQGANWQSGTAPAGSRGATVEFLNGQTLAGGGVTAHQDLGGAFLLNALRLAGTSSAAATVTVTGGALHLLDNGMTNPQLDLTATAGGGFAYDVATPVVLGAPVTVSGDGTAAFRFSGEVSGPGALVKRGASTLTLAGGNTFTGPLTIEAGTLRVGDDGPAGSLGPGDITNDATLRFDRIGTLAVPNKINGAGGLRIDCPIGAGTIELTGDNGFTGNVTIQSGALRITHASALGLGTKTVQASNGTAGNPQLRLAGGAAPIDVPATIGYVTSNSTTGAIVNEAGDNRLRGNITLTSGGGDTKLVVLAGTLTLDGDLAPNTTSRNLRLLGSGAGVIHGAIRNGGTANVLVSVQKQEAGRWTLNGPVEHTGGIAVSGGTLVVNCAVTAASGVSVASGATLGGTGTIAAATTVSGNHEPGDGGAGTQQFTGSLAFGSAARLQWELHANAEAAGDRVVVGSVTVTSGAAVNVHLDRPGSAVDFTDPFWAAVRSWPVLTYTDRTGGFLLGAVSADTRGRPAAGYGAFSLQHTAGGVTLAWAPRPPVEQWRFTWFGSNANSGPAADGADPERDGLPNLLEFATGTDPTRAAPPPWAARAEPGAIVVNFPRDPAATDVVLAVEWSDTLGGGWSDAGVSYAVTGGGDGLLQQVQATVPSPPGVERRFVRLRAARE